MEAETGMIDISASDLNITITTDAFNQIKLIQDNDYTIQDQVFRLKIDGKGCNGFDYALGFTEAHPDDLKYTFNQGDSAITFNIDPFTAYYCKLGKVDYISNVKKMVEGFHFENLNEKDHRGKFFKNESKVPTLK
jgi:Fe-S cluster assembly iron-binding protein IscA